MSEKQVVSVELKKLKQIRKLVNEVEELEVTAFQKPEAVRYLGTVNKRIEEVERQLQK